MRQTNFCKKAVRYLSIVFLSIFLLCTCGKEEEQSRTEARGENTINDKSAVAKKIQALTVTIEESVKPLIAEKGRIKVAVIELENLSNRAREENLGRIVSELLTTSLIQADVFSVIEREQLEKVMKEHKLNMTGIIDVDSAKQMGMILAVDAILCGSVSEIKDFIDINVRLIDVENASIMTAAVIEIRTSDFLRDLPPDVRRKKITAKQEIQKNLDLLNEAIHSYSLVNTHAGKHMNVVFPKTLKALVPDYIAKVPDPGKGKWIYDSKTGEIRNSAFPDLSPTVAHVKMQPQMDRSKCSSVEAEAMWAVAAISDYFANPMHNSLPNVIDLMEADNFYPENKIEITGDLSKIKITAFDRSGKCPLGKQFVYYIPSASGGKWETPE